MAVETRIVEIRAEVDAVKEKATAISPQLVEAISAFSERDMVGKMTEAMAPLAIFRKAGVGEVVAKLFEGTRFAKHILREVQNGVAEEHAPDMDRAASE